MPRAYSRVITTPAGARLLREVRPVVSLTTDFGLRDPSAAICKGVVLGIAPDALVIDVSHEVEKYAIRDGALMLWCALPYLPIGAHVGVVDPGVGTDRLPIALETQRGDVLIGPDNGILLPGAERLGGITRAHLVESHEYRLPNISHSFHGRDIFSPAAAHVALGVPIEALGRELDARRLVVLDWPEPEPGDGVLVSTIVYVDTFGNVKLAGEPTDLDAGLGPLEPGTRLRVDADGIRPFAATWTETFAGVSEGDALVYEDSYGRLCMAVNRGNLAQATGLKPDVRVSIRRA